MKNIEETISNAKNKSIKKGIPIKYKGQIIRLDPAKTSVAAFGLTASLVIAGVASSKLINAVKTEIKNNDTIVAYEDDVYQTWNDNNDIYRVNNNRSYAIDYIDIANDILKNEEEREQKLFSFVVLRKKNESDELISTLAFIEDKNYSTLEEYVIDRGFNSVDEWSKYCKEQILDNSENNKRGM